MSDRGRELLPPEEATSWDEFQDRWVIERARYQDAGRSWRDTGRILLSVIPGLAAVVFWVAFAVTGHGGRWVLLVLALACTALFGWALGGVLRRRWQRARKRRELDQLRDQWHERAERGEIPRTSRGGAKVWRDEIPVEPPGDKQPSLSKQRYGADLRNGVEPDRTSYFCSNSTMLRPAICGLASSFSAIPRTGQPAEPRARCLARNAMWTAKRTGHRPPPPVRPAVTAPGLMTFHRLIDNVQPLSGHRYR